MHQSALGGETCTLVPADQGTSHTATSVGETIAIAETFPLQVEGRCTPDDATVAVQPLANPVSPKRQVPVTAVSPKQQVPVTAAVPSQIKLPKTCAYINTKAKSNKTKNKRQSGKTKTNKFYKERGTPEELRVLFEHGRDAARDRFGRVPPFFERKSNTEFRKWRLTYKTTLCAADRQGACECKCHPREKR